MYFFMYMLLLATFATFFSATFCYFFRGKVAKEKVAKVAKLNNSMNKQLQEIVEKHRLERHKHMRVVSKYDTKIKGWMFMGYACSKCEQTLRTEYLAKKHLCNPALARKCIREEVTENIKTVSGKPYKQLL